MVGPGDVAEATGAVTRTHGGHGVIADGASHGVIGGIPAPIPPDMPIPRSAPSLVPVKGPADDETVWERFLGRRVTAVGTWDGWSLRVAVVRPPRRGVREGIEVDYGSRPQAAPRTDEATFPPFSPERVRRAEGPLHADGSILWRVVVPQDDGSFRVVVAAHDADRVRAVLIDVYGDALEVVPSPWQPEVYGAIDAIGDLAEHQGVLYESMRGVDDDGVVRCRLGLQRVTTDLARALHDLPEGVLDLDVLLAPAVLD